MSSPTIRLFNKHILLFVTELAYSRVGEDNTVIVVDGGLDDDIDSDLDDDYQSESDANMNNRKCCNIM